MSFQVQPAPRMASAPSANSAIQPARRPQSGAAPSASRPPAGQHQQPDADRPVPARQPAVGPRPRRQVAQGPVLPVDVGEAGCSVGSHGGIMQRMDQANSMSVSRLFVEADLAAGRRGAAGRGAGPLPAPRHAPARRCAAAAVQRPRRRMARRARGPRQEGGGGAGGRAHARAGRRARCLALLRAGQAGAHRLYRREGDRARRGACCSRC